MMAWPFFALRYVSVFVFFCLHSWCADSEGASFLRVAKVGCMHPKALRDESIDLPTWDLRRLYTTPAEACQDSWGERKDALERLCQCAVEITKETPYKVLREMLDEVSFIREKVSYGQGYLVFYCMRGVCEEEEARCLELSEKLKGILPFFVKFWSSVARCDVGYLRTALCAPELREYRVWLRAVLTARKHTLDPEEEYRRFLTKSVIDRTVGGHAALQRLSHMRFVFEGKCASIPDIKCLLYNNDEHVRCRAMGLLLSVFWQEDANFLSLFNSVVRVQSDSAYARHYEDVDSAMHLSNDLDEEWVTELRSSVLCSFEKTSHVLTKMLCDVLGKKSLEAHDMCAPLLPARLMPWREAFGFVCEAYRAIDASIPDLLRVMVQEGRLNLSIEHAGSCSFCWMTGKGGAYVFSRYFEFVHDFVGLAHECGHAAQDALSQSLPTLITHSTCRRLVLTETAACFSARLCVEYAMHQLPQEAADALFVGYVSYQVHAVQGYIASDIFEKTMHVLAAGGGVTLQEMRRAWLSLRGKFFGELMELPELYGSTWASAAYLFCEPFSIYSYALAGLVARTLHAQKDQPDFSGKYKIFLAQGGAMSFGSMRELFGLSGNPAKFFKDALDLIIEDVEAARRIVERFVRDRRTSE